MDPTIAELFRIYKERIHAYLSERLVNLTFLHARQEELPNVSEIARHQARPEFRTGFLIEIDHEWFVATAGHVIEGIGQLGKKGRRLVEISAFAGYGKGRTSSIEVPISAKKLEFGYDEHSGIDVGLIQLTLDERKAFVSAGSDAFRPEQYAPPDFEPHLFVATGFPSGNRDASTSQTESAQSVTTKQLYPLIPILPVRDDRAESGKHPHFRGVRLGRSQSVALIDLNGMSGGPIVAIKMHFPTGGQYRYDFSLRAIQSFEDSRQGNTVLGGSYVELLINLHRRRKYE